MVDYEVSQEYLLNIPKSFWCARKNKKKTNYFFLFEFIFPPSQDEICCM